MKEIKEMIFKLSRKGNKEKKQIDHPKGPVVHKRAIPDNINNKVKLLPTISIVIKKDNSIYITYKKIDDAKKGIIKKLNLS